MIHWIACLCTHHTGADITDYFNYGFTEETWKLYNDKQRRLRAEVQQLNKIAVSFVQDKPTLSEYWYLSSRKHNCSRCRGSYSRSLSVSNIDEFLHCVVALLDLICLVCSTVNNTIFTRNNTASHLFSLVQTLITTYNYQFEDFHFLSRH